MSVLTEKTNEKLLELKKQYIRKLPIRYNEIKKLAVKVANNEQNEEILSDLRMKTHKMAGSAATFGLQELTDRARILENFAIETAENRQNIDQKKRKVLIGYLKDIREICADPGCYEQSDDDAGTEFSSEDEDKKIVFVLGSGDHISQDLSEQLGYFGYAVEKINEIQQLSSHMKDARNELLIMNTSVIEKNSTTVKQIMKIKEDPKRELGIIFFSERDDFDIRLKCVKAGGDDFFTIPLDVGRLIDRVDSLTNEDRANPYHVLIVDDDPDQVSYYALLLQQAGMITSVASDPQTVLNILAESKPDLILMDMYMPICNGTELAAIIRQQEAFVSIPIVFLSFESNKEVQLKAIKIGADDFLTKPIKAEHLVSAVCSKAERNRQLRRFMETDSLTGLLNHTNIKEALHNEVLRAERAEVKLCFGMIDIDHFKKVNDTHGHMTGDRVLKSLARLLQDRLRRTDIIGRYGGEEFAVILLNTDLINAESIMDGIRQSFSQIRHVSTEGDFYVTFSCGISGFPDRLSSGELNASADQALYTAKENGRNRIVTDSGY